SSFGYCTSTDVLIIDSTLPDITNIYPTALDIAYKQGTDQIIVRFTYTEMYPQTTTVSLYDSLGASLVSTTTTLPATPITGGTDLLASATLIFSGLSDGVCPVTVSILDMSGNLNTCTSPKSVIIDSTKATVTVISAIPQYAKSGTNIEVVFTYSEQNPNTATVAIGTAGTTYGSITNIVIGTSGTNVYVTTTVTLFNAGPDGTLAVTVYVGDKVGNVGTDSKDLILFDNNPPDIVNLYPIALNKAYRKGTDTLIVQFTYTEMTPRTCTVSILDNANSVVTETTTTDPSTFLPAGTNQNGSATLNFTDVANGTYTVRVMMEDGASSFGYCTSTDCLIIDNTLPTLEVYSGQDAVWYKAGTGTLTIYYTYTE
ncbi:MAG: hypothetical protein AAB296_03220, partial [Candidatus Desantisbacteria bacterium]